MPIVVSKDGTPIGYDVSGAGVPVIFAVGAFNDRTRCAPLAAALADSYRPVVYDRRARGESGDTPPYAVDREVEDLAALIDAVGGEAAVFGYSSGGVLALKAAADGVRISRLALFEVPFALGGLPAGPADAPARMAELVDSGRPGDAVAMFQRDVIGLPPPVTEQMRQSPMWASLEAMARSVVYDTTITSEFSTPTPAMAAVTTPTLVMVGAATWPGLRGSAEALAALLPAATFLAVEGGENHDIPVDTTADALREFLG
jgi:pimeloyl-ACP methyl ester carboxylesterase